jgi:hypothetical protein
MHGPRQSNAPNPTALRCPSSGTLARPRRARSPPDRDSTARPESYTALILHVHLPLRDSSVRHCLALHPHPETALIGQFQRSRLAVGRGIGGFRDRLGSFVRTVSSHSIGARPFAENLFTLNEAMGMPATSPSSDSCTATLAFTSFARSSAATRANTAPSPLVKRMDGSMSSRSFRTPRAPQVLRQRIIGHSADPWPPLPAPLRDR